MEITSLFYIKRAIKDDSKCSKNLHAVAMVYVEGLIVQERLLLKKQKVDLTHEKMKHLLERSKDEIWCELGTHHSGKEGEKTQPIGV